jgi:hypothetical protein
MDINPENIGLVDFISIFPEMSALGALHLWSSLQILLVKSNRFSS